MAGSAFVGSDRTHTSEKKKRLEVASPECGYPGRGTDESSYTRERERHFEREQAGHSTGYNEPTDPPQPPLAATYTFSSLTNSQSHSVKPHYTTGSTTT